MARRAWISAGAPIAVLVLLVTVLSAAVVANFARTQDRGWTTESRRLMQSALDERTRAVANQAWDYGAWNEAYIGVTQAWDQEWVDGNYYTSVADGLIVFRPDADGARYVWLADRYASQSDAIDASVFEAARATLANGPRRPALGERYVVSGRVIVDGKLAIYSVAPVMLIDGSVEPLDYVVILEIFEADELAEIGSARDLEQAAFSEGNLGADSEHVTLPVRGDDVLGYIVWRNERPGSKAFAGNLWPIILSLLTIGLMAVVVTRRLVGANVKVAAEAEASHERARMRAEFISTMSHELRTPLNAIIGYAELIQEEAQDLDQGAEVISADAGHVLGAAKHLRRLVDDILDHSRFDAGRLSLAIEPLPPDLLLTELHEVMTPLARNQNDELVIRNLAIDWNVLADDVRARQCLINLVANAVKFTRNGQVMVTARLQSNEAGAVIVFDVADTGIGIEQELVDRLFEPFAQAQGAGQSSYGGAGLGLSISRKLARAMGGDITVVSEYGHGSTFSLTLPAAPKEEFSQPPAQRLAHAA